VTPCVHYSMGGVAFKETGELLDRNDEIIEGFYGAGEVTGGLHGENRLAGNSLLETVVMGRRAGRSALKKSLEAQ